ncbi:MAG: ATP-dependent helicase HrpB [Rhodobacteraceae bacterium]|nr:ATP-dependent helicase HrpB [Paracoccaceae bacterium]
MPGPPLPADAALPDLLAALRSNGAAVLVAPPGAGKTTRVPLALMGCPDTPPGRIVMLEPRRLAARTSAERMADTLGEPLGGRVGYRIRGERRIGPETRIEVVTEGILTRMIQDDPALEGVGAVIFDEYHERSLNADLGLALALEARAALRPDLWLVVMSATLEAEPVAAILGGPVVRAEGRRFPVEMRHIAPGPPLPLRGRDFEAAAARLIVRALEETEGGVLAFLPGEGEIARVASALAPRLPPEVRLRPLFGAMKLADQRAAIRPEEGAGARKLVLATAIAETSLTIEDVRVVVDTGRARRARFDPGSGMTRLVTERVSRAEAEQRAGRAGRLAPGVAYRLWPIGAQGALPAVAPPEIETADLAGLALELALWGVRGEVTLALLTPPPEGPLAEARALLRSLGALADDGAITTRGREMARLPLHPRLAAMVLAGGRDAALAAALLSERDPWSGEGRPADLSLRWSALRGGPGRLDPARAARIRETAALIPTRRDKGDAPAPGLAELAAIAYPDRIARRRDGDAPRWLMAGGGGAALPREDSLSGAEWLVITDLDPGEGRAHEARIRTAVAPGPEDLAAMLRGRAERVHLCQWDPRTRNVRARRQERLGAIVLSETPWPECPDERLTAALLEGVRDLGLSALGWTRAARLLQSRVRWARAAGADLPDLGDAALLDSLGEWLAPFAAGVRKWEALAAMDLLPALRGRLGTPHERHLDQLAPARYTAPTGTQVAIDYGGEAPEIAIRLQEMFGLTKHPTTGPGGPALRIALLSPAGHLLQTTEDLPGFWRGSYADVRRDMRGRYPRHPWPETPEDAQATRRAKPRGQ